MAKPVALIVGVGDGLSASLARLLTRDGYVVALAARNVAKLAGLAIEIDGHCYSVDAVDAAQVAALFEALDADLGPPEVVIYNASGRERGPLINLNPAAVAQAITVSAFGGFLVAQQAARRMEPLGRGTILLTGASASVKGYAQSAPFAMGKFALRGLAQSIARELAPKGIHVAHIVIDGAIRSASRLDPMDRPDSTLDPDAIGQSYLDLIHQPRNAWTWEIELRPWVETF